MPVLVFRGDDRLAAHVRTKHFGNGHAAVCLQMVFDKRDQHTGRRDNGVVQGVRQLSLAVVVLITNGQASCLRVRKIRTRTDLEIFLLSGALRFDVTALVFEICKIACAAAELSYGDIHRAEQLYSVAPQLFIPFVALFGTANDDHFLFLELVDTVNTAFLDPVCALFLSKTRRLAGERQRQFFAVDDLTHISADHGMFGRTDQV